MPAPFIRDRVDHWTPRELFRNGATGIWVDPSDFKTMDQTTTLGTTAVVADGDPVGYIGDKSGNGFHLTQGTAGSRPTYKTAGGISWLEFDGTADYLSRTAALGMFAASSVSCFAAVRYDSPAVSRTFAGDGSSASNTPRYAFMCDNETASTFSMQITNDAGITPLNGSTDQALGVFSSTPIVVGITDNSVDSTTSYKNQTAQASVGYTRSGVQTVDLFGIGVLVRATPVVYYGGRIYGLVIVNAKISPDSIRKLVTYLGAKSGQVI